ncbi:MAG: IS5 family transposase [Akkermansiaceae bacterium]|nr:IS5 family transposase [Akkermansiaceae bacterium]
MTHQPSFSQAEFADKKKTTRREKFLARMEDIIPWQSLFNAINADLSARGLTMREGTLVDATLIAAPPSTKNKDKKRDPEMHQTRKGNQWYFGMKAHIGADRDSKLVDTLVVTAANVSDIAKTSELLHGQETQVHADAGYTGVEKREEITQLDRKIDWQIAIKRSKVKQMEEGMEKETLKATEHAKASVRAFVEHPFHIVKNLFHHRKTRYRGLAKNSHQLHALFGLANLVIAARKVTA